MDRREQLKLFDDTIFMVYNTIRKTKDFLTLKNKKLKQNILLKNIKRNKKCYILGNGPSLNLVEFKKLDKNADYFTTNYFFNGFNKNWNFLPLIHVLVDEMFYQDDNLDYIKKTYKENNRTYFIMKKKYQKEALTAIDNLEHVFFIDNSLAQYKSHIEIDFTKNTTACINVVLCCIQLALYMEYEKIYLFGCDFNTFATLKPEHFYSKDCQPNYIKKTKQANDLHCSALAMYHHYALENYAQIHNIKIYNATERSLIDAYERISLEDLYQKF